VYAKAIFRGFLGVFGFPSKWSQKYEGWPCPEIPKTPLTPLLEGGFRGFAAILVTKSPKTPFRRLWVDLGTKIGFPGPFSLWRKPQIYDFGSFAPQKGAGKPIKHYCRTNDIRSKLRSAQPSEQSRRCLPRRPLLTRTLARCSLRHDSRAPGNPWRSSAVRRSQQRLPVQKQGTRRARSAQ